MLFFLYGEDSFRSRQKLRELMLEFQKKSPGDQAVFVFLDFEKEDFESFLDKTKNQSLFSARKFLVLENTLTDPTASQRVVSFLKLLKDGEKDLLVFFEEKAVEAKNPLAVFLKKNARTQEFQFLKGAELRSWIAKEVAALGGRATPAAVNRLSVLGEGDPWRLANEIKKAVANKDAKLITPGDVVWPEKEVDLNVFQMIDELAAGRTGLALSLLKKHLGRGDSPFRLLSMVNYQFRNLLLVKSLLDAGLGQASVTARLGLNGFVGRKSCVLAQKFTRDDLKRVYARLLEVDVKIKTGELLPRQGLEFLFDRLWAKPLLGPTAGGSSKTSGARPG